MLQHVSINPAASRIEKKNVVSFVRRKKHLFFPPVSCLATYSEIWQQLTESVVQKCLIL